MSYENQPKSLLTLTSSHKLDNPFDDFYLSPVYLEYKKNLYNYQLRKRAIHKSLGALHPEDKILEVGAGVSPMMQPLGNVFFTDTSDQAIDFLVHKYGAQHASIMDMEKIHFANDSFTHVVCSEVLEHVKNDQLAIQEVFRVLKPGGKFVLTVPIHPKYYGFDDHYVGHQRRYGVWPLLKVIRKNGFKINHYKPVTGFLDKFFTVLAVRLYSFVENNQKEKTTLSSKRLNKICFGLLPIYKVANFVFKALVALEAKMLPIQTSAVLLIQAEKDQIKTRKSMDVVKEERNEVCVES